MIPLTPRAVKFIKTQRGNLGLGGRVQWGIVVYGYRVSVGEDEKTFKMDDEVVAQYEVLNATKLKTVKMVNFMLWYFTTVKNVKRVKKKKKSHRNIEWTLFSLIIILPSIY